jgi:hypothetical protein
LPILHAAANPSRGNIPPDLLHHPLCSFALKTSRNFSLCQILSSLLLQLFGPIHSVYLWGELCYLYSLSGYEHRVFHIPLPFLEATHWSCSVQWRTQDFFWEGGGGYARNFFGGRGVFNKFSWGQRTERTGIWGRQPHSQGFHSICKWVKTVFWLGCYGTVNSAQLCQNFGISGGGGELPNPPRYATGSVSPSTISYCVVIFRRYTETSLTSV